MTDTLSAPQGARADDAAPEDEILPPEAVEPELAPPTEEELLRADRQLRRRRRRRLMLWGIVPALLMLLMAAKLLSMTFIGGHAVGQYEEGDFEGSMNTSELLKTANFIEAWKAHYDVGTNALELGLLDQARAELETALGLASPGEQCPIRNNLGIAIERQGDAKLEAGDEEGARALWEEALAIVEASDPSCGQTSSAEALVETHERIWRKLNPPDGGGGGEDDQQQSSGEQDEQQQSSGDQEQQQGQDQQQGQGQTPEEQLQEQMGQNEQQRHEQLDQEEGGGGSSGSDTPW